MLYQENNASVEDNTYLGGPQTELPDRNNLVSRDGVRTEADENGEQRTGFLKRGST
jgi:hypothetical protein